MDVFKLAFETTIAGLLAFLWLGLAVYLVFPAFVHDFVIKKGPGFVAKNQTLAGIAILTFTYCLGSAILPIAQQLVNDDHWPLTENAIRCQVFTRQELQLLEVHDLALPDHNGLAALIPRHCSYWAPILQRNITFAQRVVRFGRLWAGTEITEDEDQPEKNVSVELSRPGRSGVDVTRECLNENSDACKIAKILTIFRQQETAILNEGTDRTERLRQLHERIVILRGAIFSAFILVLMFLFAFFAKLDGLPRGKTRTALGLLLPLVFAVFAALNGIQDVRNRDIFDLPVLEGLLGTISIFGAYLVVRGIKSALFRKKRLLLAVLFFAALAYGGWMNSEILYDQLVISSYAVLRGDAQPKQHAKASDLAAPQPDSPSQP
jgi:hypothetical protein